MAKIQNEKEKKDYFTVVMITQSIVCAVLIAIMLLSVKSDGNFFRIMKKGYLDFMTSDFSDEDFSEAFKTVKEYVAVFAQEEASEAPSTVNATEISSEPESFVEEEIPTGGVDIEFSALDTLEGICFDTVDVGLDMIVPLKEYRLTSPFGYRINPVSGVPGIHTGTDMAAPQGTSIYAAAEGTVITSAWDNSYGYNVKILHDNNVVTVYAHCSRLCVKEGDTLKQGEKIAEVGSTGNSTGNHLHFEIRKDNIKVDPRYLLES